MGEYLWDLPVLRPGPPAGLYGFRMETYPLVEARNQLGQLVARVRYGHAEIVISEYGRPAAALVSIEELEELRRIRDEVDIAELKARKAEPTGPRITHDEFMAQLEAEDAQALAS
ncbi:type II toxin-antitoxin system Phd/YefM family antitoxin [Streptomyces scopuliridis]|uniref:type II toxin-antitoxin system Phd/YefM family antitoxin n=1 Tax=Streptomyces scopuliridis TaxID=452529 RepID=UPI0036A51228